MTTPEALNALADRVEREEPSRQLDVFIACAVLDLEREPATGYVGGPPPWAWHTRPRGRGWWNTDIRHIEGYTTSLDSAVTLVPTNFSYELTFSAAGEGAMRRARLWDWRRGPLMIDPANEWAATAKTLPAALTAAALRARAALSPTDEGTGSGR